MLGGYQILELKINSLSEEKTNTDEKFLNIVKEYFKAIKKDKINVKPILLRLIYEDTVTVIFPQVNISDGVYLFLPSTDYGYTGYINTIFNDDYETIDKVYKIDEI